MEIRRFYVSEPIKGDVVTVSGDEFRHMTGVLRYKVGYKAIICDNSGYDYNVTITDIDKTCAVCRVDSKVLNESEATVNVTLFMCPLKSDKYDLAVQKAVELGVNRIVPVISHNTNERNVRRDRLERIVLEASKQCGRAKLAAVDEQIWFEQAIEQLSACELPLMAYEFEREVDYKTALSKDGVVNIGILIGSEGGFTEAEATAARAKGIILFSLGKRILRAETAAITAIGSIMLRYDG